MSGTERECSGCGNRGTKVETRPVILVNSDEPRRVCPSCYEILEAFDLVDHERDAEAFGYDERSLRTGTDQQEGGDD